MDENDSLSHSAWECKYKKAFRCAVSPQDALRGAAAALGRGLRPSAEKKQRSVTITGNWRLVFRFEDGEALDVDLVDYH